MLKGFHYPLTPKGKSTLNPPPPWYYSADFLDIEFWSDPAAVAAVLPPGLDPDPKTNGHGNALFYDWQFTDATDEYLDRLATSIVSFFCWLTPCLRAGRYGIAHTSSSTTTQRPPVGGRRVTRSALARSLRPATMRQQVRRARHWAPGSKFAGSLTASGGCLAQALVTLKEPVTSATLRSRTPGPDGVPLHYTANHIEGLRSDT
jgi:acetoacetate decarboxylase